MTDDERKAARDFINEYIDRKQAQGEWDPDVVGVMRIAFEGGINYERARSERYAELLRDVLNIQLIADGHPRGIKARIREALSE